MEVLIDGVLYEAVQNRNVTDKHLQALDVRIPESDAGDNITVRDYLFSLLERLWDEGEDFSGKRLFGNSGWRHDLYIPLVKAGFIGGVLDEGGNMDEYDGGEAYDFVDALIRIIFYGKREA